jgi:hypothetical protein
LDPLERPAPLDLLVRCERPELPWPTLPYGDRFGGASEIPCSDAFDCTARGVRPSFTPITRVGVFSFTNCFSSLTSCGVHGLPVLRVDLVVAMLVSFSFQRHLHRQ